MRLDKTRTGRKPKNHFKLYEAGKDYFSGTETVNTEEGETPQQKGNT
jgi:hypothetical protein